MKTLGLQEAEIRAVREQMTQMGMTMEWEESLSTFRWTRQKDPRKVVEDYYETHLSDYGLARFVLWEAAYNDLISRGAIQVRETFTFWWI